MRKTHIPGLAARASHVKFAALACQAVASVERADVAVLVVGIDTYMEGEGNDRVNTSLSFAEKQLGRAVLAVGKPVVVVVVGAGCVSFDPLLGGGAEQRASSGGRARGAFERPANEPSAIIEAGYLCDNQRALADLMFGRRNRWGKLAHTIYREEYALTENKIPTARDCGCTGEPGAYRACVECSVGYLNMSMRPAPGTSNPGRGYRYYSGSPLYNFSHGLSLTNFSLVPVDAAPRQRHADVGTIKSPAGAVSAAVRVTNTGSRAGDEVVFAFFTPGELDALPGTGARLVKPSKQLIAFQRVSLAPQASTTVRFDITARNLSLVSEAGARWVASGTYTVRFTNGVGQGHAKTVRVLPSAAHRLSTLPDGAV